MQILVQLLAAGCIVLISAWELRNTEYLAAFVMESVKDVTVNAGFGEVARFFVPHILRQVAGIVIQ